MKKQAFLFLALALIVAGGAFAQRVGGTYTLDGQAYIVESVSGDRVTLLKVGSLNGVWDKTAGGNNITVLTFSGTSGVITAFDQGGAAHWRDAANKGFIKVGDPLIRNIQSTGANTWSCEVFDVEYRGGTALGGIRWDNGGTITMQADGTIRLTMASVRNWYTDFKKR